MFPCDHLDNVLDVHCVVTKSRLVADSVIVKEEVPVYINHFQRRGIRQSHMQEVAACTEIDIFCIPWRLALDTSYAYFLFFQVMGGKDFFPSSFTRVCVPS